MKVTFKGLKSEPILIVHDINSKYKFFEKFSDSRVGITNIQNTFDKKKMT
jgi:hypothetical protein